MAIEKLLKCPHCQWEGRRTVETVREQSDWKAFTTLIGVGLQGVKCPDSGEDTVTTTKELVS